jgi:D-xylose 1-dehydrogenase (NADP+, D-xylono-1,5-lactone-forming)
VTTAHPLRIGVLGAARIARGFVVGVRESTTVTVTAVASRDAGRAQQFASEFGVPHAFGSYDAMLHSGEIEAVYNPLPNSLHASWSIRAMQAGKHVLCEKPLAVSRAEAISMFDAARAHGVRLAEAYPYRSQPQTLELQRLLRDGVIGQVRTIHAAFGYQLRDRSDIRFDPTLGGGALMDLGCYPLSLIRMITGQMPVAMQALGVWDDAGVDRAAIVSLSFADGVLAQAACSFESAIHRQALIAGDNGVIETTFANQTTDTPPVLRLRRGVGRQAPVEEIAVPGVNGFLAEAEAFAAHVAGAPWTGISEAESLDMAELLAAAFAQLSPRSQGYDARM